MKSKVRARPMVRPSLCASFTTGLSFISSLITASILGYFVDALRRAYTPVPYPIVLVMSASCLNVSLLFVTALVGYFFPASVIVRLFFHIPIAVLWIVTVAILGDELGDHLVRGCPSADDFGNDLALVCQLFKALFAFAILSTLCSLQLVVLDILTWRSLKKAATYTAIGRKNGGAATQTPGGKGNKKKMGMITGILRRRNRNVQEDERSIMMNDMHLEEKQNDMLRPDTSTTSPSQQTNVPSPEWGPTDRMLVDKSPNQFAGQETRYDPGTRIF